MKPETTHRQSKERSLQRVPFASMPFFDETESLDSLNQSFKIVDLAKHPIDWAEEGSHAVSLQTQQDILAWTLAVLSKSPTARLMIQEAIKTNWRLSIDDLGNRDFHMNMREGLIVLDNNGLQDAGLVRSEYFRSSMIIALIRALRDIWQESRNPDFEDNYDPEAILMIERVRAADCDVLSMLVGWELRSEGFGDLWRHLIGSAQGDIAIAFSNHLERDPSSLFSGKALQSAFKQWYQNVERINACDHETLEYCDELLSQNPYNSPFGNEYLKPITIERISCLPDKTAYLRDCGLSILSNPHYAGMHGAINQSHFLQIMHDLKATTVEGVSFRDPDLAAKIFPNGNKTNTL